MIIKYHSPVCNPQHQDYHAKGNLPKGTKPTKVYYIDPMVLMRRHADYQTPKANN
jgi:hypothetical protein